MNFRPDSADHRSWQQQLARCTRRDRLRLERRLRRLRGTRQRAEMVRQLERAQRVYQRRVDALPQPRFDPDLPINSRRAEIEDAIRAHQVVVVCGETGSGKSTQLPKMCLALGRGIAGYIGHTQPRRIAARSVAARLATELNGAQGAVGYKIRFRDTVRDDTYIKVVTDGMLLAELEHDRRLDQYDTLILDEAHERSLNVDFLLGYLQRLLPQRPDLKLIVTSATIDPQSFSRYFDGAPVIEVSGRTHAVTTRYRPLGTAEGEQGERDREVAIVRAVDELAAAGPGDILVFLPGERDIRKTAELLRRRRLRDTEILPLYARLSAVEQQRVFAPHPGRRIVLATNVAETSLTVPGIRYVIDTGLARIKRYRPGRQVQALPVEPVSQASANQRQGRCGRLADGICIRLYPEEDFLARARFTEPEILRSSLAGVILKMAHLGLGDISEFPFLDPPPPRLINDGYRLLEELGALDERRGLSAIGRQLARLPIDPRLGRMLLEAHEQQALREVLTIAAALSIADPREYPEAERERARAQHQRYRQPDSDFLTLLNLWEVYRRETAGMNQRRQRNYCRDQLLSYTRMREWQDMRNQLLDLARELGLTLNADPASADAVHRALLAGLLGNLACAHEGYEYRGTRGKKLFIHPASGLFKSRPKWFMAAELIDTERLYAHMLATVKPEWAEPLAPDLVRREYREPRWQAREGRVLASERVDLFGLTLINQRTVHYGPIDPVGARSLFLQEALVAGRFSGEPPFLRHNRALVAQLRELEQRTRRRDILVSEEHMFEFYDRRVPAGIYTARAFKRWLANHAEQARALHMTRSDLMLREAQEVTPERFPETLTVTGNDLALRYHFEPGHANDGVTATVPLALLPQLSPASCSWLVPGLLREKIIALIRSLPKAKRRHFAPAPDFAARALDLMTPGQEDLTTALATALQAITGVALSDSDWDLDKLAPHLRMNFRVLDEQGTTLASDRDLPALQQQIAARDAGQTDERAGGLEQQGLVDWTFGDLPAELSIMRRGVRLVRYPGLVDEGDSVALRLFAAPAEAAAATRSGLRRLLMLALPQQARVLRKPLPQQQRMCLHFSTVADCESLRMDLQTALWDRMLPGDNETLRNADSFQDCVQRTRERLLTELNQLCELVDQCLCLFHDCRRQVAPAPAPVAADVRQQLDWLIYPGFISQTPPEWLQHYPRYLKAVLLRLARSREDARRDDARRHSLDPWWQRLIEAASPQQLATPALRDYRWNLEEYRVSLFAQELKTAVKVSPQRLERLWRQAVAGS